MDNVDKYLTKEQKCKILISNAISKHYKFIPRSFCDRVQWQVNQAARLEQHQSATRKN